MKVGLVREILKLARVSFVAWLDSDAALVPTISSQAHQRRQRTISFPPLRGSIRAALQPLALKDLVVFPGYRERARPRNHFKGGVFVVRAGTAASRLLDAWWKLRRENAWVPHGRWVNCEGVSTV